MLSDPLMHEYRVPVFVSDLVSVSKTCSPFTKKTRKMGEERTSGRQHMASKIGAMYKFFINANTVNVFQKLITGYFRGKFKKILTS
jgi:hypothetical protein